MPCAKSKSNRFFVTFLLVFTLFLSGQNLLKAQVELVPVSNPVYDFLKRMQLEGYIPDYNSSNIPVSRGEVADYLKIVKSNSINLETIDKNLLGDYYVEFGYDIDKNLDNSSSFLGKNRNSNIFEDKKQKYIFAHADSTVAFFFDGRGSLSYRGSTGDSLGNNSISLGEIGFRMRGTFLNILGFYLNPSGGKKLSGNKKDALFARKYDTKLHASSHFGDEGKTFDSFEGYLRYQSKSREIAVTLGREAINQGFGYTDKLFLSNNTVPYDYIRLDLSYKIFHYNYLYGQLKGDSLGRELQFKNIVTQRLDVKFSDKFRMGFWESLIISDNPFYLTYLNPLSFIFSADINTQGEQTIKNNTLFGFDMEIIPFKNLSVQGSLLIDDMNFSTIYSKDSSTNDNKFGYQVGLLWNKVFNLPGMSLAMEYTKLSPYTLSHRLNKSQYTHWEMPLGPSISPNTDEIAARLIYYPFKRLRLDLKFQHQRSAEGLEFDSTGKLVMNYGGYIYRGDGELLNYNYFLNGNRINRDILTMNLVFEPVRQYFLEFYYQFKYQNLLYLNKKSKDHIFFMTFRMDF
ncbi:MAG: hypothetical protein HY959_06335 [Ignavibacteriae bacterium]|nr:hypothetical protein [Ignavibacteriota bacterium]